MRGVCSWGYAAGITVQIEGRGIPLRWGLLGCSGTMRVSYCTMYDCRIIYKEYNPDRSFIGRFRQPG